MKNNKLSYPFISMASMLLASLLLLQVFSCKKPKKVEEELITKVKLTLKQAGSPDTSFIWQDPDGPGGNSPLLPDSMYFNDSTTYTVLLEFFDQSNGRNENLTTVIRDEAANHLLCFRPDGQKISVTITDSDGNLPLGLQSEWKTEGWGHGSMNIRLRHQPGVKNGSCDPGETDVEVNFPYFIAK